MANYWITPNARFRPFSYDEMIRPVEKMYTEHKGIEEGLAELQTKAGIWEGLANEQTDHVTYAQYKRYADELRMAADDLAMNGLNARSRQNLYNMKARYASEITPIEQAYTRRRELADEQRKLNVQNNGALRFDNDFSTMSLDNLITNPELSYQALNGEAIAQRTSNMISNLAKSITSDPQYKSILGGQYWQVMQQAGYTPSQIVAMAQNDPSAPPELKVLRSTIHNSLRNNPAYDENWVDQWINQGAYSGIGGTNYSTMGDQSYLNAAQRQSMAINAQKMAWEREDRERANQIIELDDGTMLDPRDATGGKIPYKVENKRRKYITGTITGSKSKSGSSSGSDNVTTLNRPLEIVVQGTYKDGKVAIGPYGAAHAEAYEWKSSGSDEEAKKLGKPRAYGELSDPEKMAVQSIIGVGNENDLNYYITSYDDGTRHIIVDPRKLQKETSYGNLNVDSNIH